jgi:hypothetical protein
MDFPRLDQDVPKYCNAGVFHDEAITWWRSFMSTFQNKYGALPSTMPQWPLLTLSRETSQGQQASELVISEKIVTLHRNQMESQPQVPLFYSV